MNKDYVLYVLVRNDLPSMNPGKAMAQVAHAANQFMFIHEKFRKNQIASWIKRNSGFGTTVVLSSSMLELVDIHSRCYGLQTVDYTIPSGWVCDETYPSIISNEYLKLLAGNVFTSPPIDRKDGTSIMFRKEYTCYYIFIDKNNPEHFALVKDFPLHP